MRSSEVTTYRSGTETRLDLTGSDWTDLSDFLADHAEMFQNARDEHGIEEDPPSVKRVGRWVFEPNGWVGKYPGGIEVVPGKLTNDEYRELLTSVAGWLEMWSPPTASTMLPLISSTVSDPRSVLLTYSEALIDYTETVMAYRPHIEVEKEEYRGYDLQGGLIGSCENIFVYSVYQV